MNDLSTKEFSPSLPALGESVGRRLRTLAFRLRAFVVLEGVAWVLGLALALGLCQLAIDFNFHLQWSIRATLTGAIVAVVAWVVWRRVVRPLRMTVDSAAAACLVEGRRPELASLLISAVRFSAGQIGTASTNSPALAASVIRRANQAVDRLDFNRAVDGRRARRSALATAMIAAVVLLASWAAPDVMGMWFQRNVLLADIEWPKRTRLIVELEGDELRGAIGDDLHIRARVQGVVPRQVDFVYETTSGRKGRETMTAVGMDALRYTFKNVRENFEFYLEGGDDRTRRFRAVLSERPRVVWSQVSVDPPAYARLDPFTLPDGQRATQVLLGSEITIEVKTNRPVTTATLMAGDEEVVEAFPQEEGWRVSVRPTQSHTYHFALTDESGLTNRRPVRFSIRVNRDEPPTVRMRTPGAGEMITAEAVLPIVLDFADTYGLAEAELVVETVGRALPDAVVEEGRRAEPALPDFRPYATTFHAELSWPVADEGVTAGDRITLFARAADFDDVSGPNVAQSPPLTLSVVTRDELLAELSRREQDYRLEFERLVDTQEDLRRRLLTVIGEKDRLGDAAAWSEALAPLERRQRTVAGSVNVVRQKFEQILTQMGINQLDTALVKDRIGQGIVEPLAELARRDLVNAADQLRRFARDDGSEDGAGVDASQARVLQKMREVLAHMIQWEGFQEALTLLREIVGLQKELNQETQREVERQGADVFDD